MSENTESVKETQEVVDAKKFYQRFTISERVEHWIFIIAFIILGITGLVQRYSELQISQWVVAAVGGIDNLRWIHHAAAIVTMVIVIYHIGAMGYRIYVKRARLTMLPVINDIVNVYHSVLYYIGVRKEAPQQGLYIFEE